MKILKTLMGFSDGDGTMFLADTIEYEGKYWLVPQWLEAPAEGWKRPARIVSLAPLKHQKSTMPGIDFVLNVPIPKAVFDGEVPTGSGAQYVVIERPDISLPTPKGIH
jgi:hypothetical protein